MNEFDLIAKYFGFSDKPRDGIVLGRGDDCAIISPQPGEQLAATTDTLVSGCHFFADGPADLIARRAMRVNLSDLAAMGAMPTGFLMAITLESVDEPWLQAFSQGLSEDAERFNCPLVGGDTTRGSGSITITMFGSVPSGRALLRSSAQVGDLIYVTGTLGDARGGLSAITAGDNQPFLVHRYWLPEPRLEIGRRLIGVASAALDISDGLVQDVGHIAQTCGLCAEINIDRIPVSADVIAYGGATTATNWALTGGDDYELCYTVCKENVPYMESLICEMGVPVTCIGEMKPFSQQAVRCVNDSGEPIEITVGGYDHFRS